MTPVRRRILRQLLESLIYEGVLTARADGDRYIVDGVDEKGRPVAYRFAMSRRYGFDRVRLGAEPVLRDGREVDSITLLLNETCAESAGFAHELEETLRKDTAAQELRVRRGDVLAGAPYDDLEAMVMDGHRYHPAYKSRIPFDLDDNAAWGPEFAEDIRPLWLAAHRSIATVTGDSGNQQEFAVLPVHPWQWREVITRTHAGVIESGKLIPLGEDQHAYRAQQSIRTLTCRDDPLRPYLKLSLSILNTSTSRVLAPHTVSNAPRITGWLQGIAAGDPYLRDLRVILLGETLGISVGPTGPGETYGALACIWRESLHQYLDPGECAVPFTGLTARELNGTPLIDGWVRGMGVRVWLRKLLEVSVLPLIHLLQRHGIALEAHAQNMVLVHENGQPTRVVLRDFHDGVRFSRAHLAEPALCPPLAEPPAYHVNRNSFLETDDPDQVADFLLDAFFFINLGELAMFLDDAYDLPEPEFWAMTRDVVAGYQQFARFDIGKPRLEVEQLTTRRLLPDTEPRMHSVPNPLHEEVACSPTR